MEEVDTAKEADATELKLTSDNVVQEEEVSTEKVEPREPLNPYNIPDIRSPLNFNHQRYKKKLRTKYEKIALLGKFKLTGTEPEFRELYKAIIDITNRCLKTNMAFQTKNYIFIISIIEMTLQECSEISKSMLKMNPNDKDNLLGHQAYIMNKNRGLLSALMDNLKNPTTLEEFFENVRQQMIQYQEELAKKQKEAEAQKDEVSEQEDTKDIQDGNESGTEEDTSTK